MVNYDLDRKRNKIFITGALMVNRLDYLNPVAAIDSRNLSRIVYLRTGTEMSIFEYSKLKVILNEELSLINSVNYSSNTSRSSTSLTLSLEPHIPGRFSTILLVREILDRNKLLIPDFSAGLQMKLLKSGNHFLKANLSRNSKIPALNDIYWVPGGNPELKNEYAFISELSYEVNSRISSYMVLTSEISFFRNDIKDMIQWRPGAFSYWTADNIRRVNTSGLETSLSLNYRHESLSAAFNAAYYFTKASDVTTETSDKQLMYVPENQINGALQIIYKIFYSTWQANYTGRRYIAVDNSKYLPGYLNNSLSTGFRIKLKENLLDINLGVDNIFNVGYQSVAYYPQPGRSYSLKLLIQLK